ncbi:MAG: hypothetical protein JWO56_2109 [Acidobacteria bacterium]|nr:hypothetical protein [Acidobacteriota bacterium]
MKTRSRFGSVFVLVLLLSGCGSVIDAPYTSTGHSFDFRQPDCPAVPEPLPAAAGVRYLGSGGVAITWQGATLLAGPYLSHAGSLVAANFGRVQFDTQRIDEGLREIDLPSVRAIITGHSHFDHIGDVPDIVTRLTPTATVYTNTSGVKMLAAYGGIQTHTVDPAAGWMHIPNSRFRIRAMRWDHAPQLCRLNRFPCTYAKCPGGPPWTTEWPKHRMRDLCGGETFAYLIDLLGKSNDEVRFRIYYNDSAASQAFAPPQLPDTRPVDLAVLCMASYNMVYGYPEALLQALQPRHVLVSHYDDFFVRQTGSWRFVPLLTNRKANRFLQRVKDLVPPLGNVSRPPDTTVCGPSTARWSMPVPGWPLYFAVP